MRKKVFFRVFCFTALAVIATVVLITLALTVAHDNTGALTGTEAPSTAAKMPST